MDPTASSSSALATRDARPATTRTTDRDAPTSERATEPPSATASGASPRARVDDFASTVGAPEAQLQALDRALTAARSAMGADGNGAAPDKKDKPEVAADKEPVRLDELRSEVITKLALPEVSLLKSRVDAEVERARAAGQPPPAHFATAAAWLDAREKALKSGLHAATAGSNVEHKHHVAAVGRQVSAGTSTESGRANQHGSADTHGPKEGERIDGRLVTREGKTHTESASTAQKTDANGNVRENITVVATDKNDKEKSKTKVTDESTSTTRKDGQVVTHSNTLTTDDKGGRKTSDKTTVVGDGQARITENKRESASLDEARKDKEKKDADDRKKVGAPTSVTTAVKLGAVESVTSFGNKKQTDKGKIGDSVSTTEETDKLNGEVKGTGEAAWDPAKGLVLTGTAGAKATLYGKTFKIEAGPFSWTWLGETLRASFYGQVSAAAAAEVGGQIAVNYAQNGNKAGIELAPGDTKSGGGAAGAKVSGFAGLKGGVELGAKVEWVKKGSYKTDLIDWIRKLLARYAPESVANLLSGRVTEYAAGILIGHGGVPTILSAKGGLEGTAGIGGEIGASVGLAGGRIKFEGKLQGTLGLGVGTSIKGELDAIEGVRLLGLLAARGATWGLEQFGLTPAQVWEKLRDKVREMGNRMADRLLEAAGEGIFAGVKRAIAQKAAEKLRMLEL